MITLIIINIFLFFLVSFAIFSVYRLNLYIKLLEDKYNKQIDLTENLKQSLTDIIAEDMLQNDGRLKKYRIQKERNFIFNGTKVDESNYEL